jgi:outer membrane receptor protein involved in Fe transport
VTTDLFSGSSWQPGAYLQHTVTGKNSRIALTYGGRFDRFSATGQNVWMPRASVSLSPLANTKLTAAFGQYAQFPTFFQLLGEFGNPSLKAERATHYTLQIEQLLNDKTRIRLEGSPSS